MTTPTPTACRQNGLENALSKAWRMLIGRYGHHVLGSRQEQERLAYLVASLWRLGVRTRLASQSVQQFEKAMQRDRGKHGAAGK